MFASLGSTATINDGISRGGYLNYFTPSLNCFIAFLNVDSSSSAVLVILVGYSEA